MGNVVRLERDEADRPLGLHRTDGLDDARRREPQAALAQRLDGDEVAVLGVARPCRQARETRGRGLLVDRDRPSRSIRRVAVDGEGARPHLLQDLDHPA